MTDARKQHVRDWLCRHALPLWLPAAQGGFAECLTSEGAPDDEAPRRVMVQARQVYVYSHASILGLMPDAAEAAQKGFDFLLRFGAPDGAAHGFVHALDRQGHVLDGTRDLYDHAFLLLAFSWYYRASREKHAARAMEDVAAAINALRHGSGRGYRENDKGLLPRRQNSHMHLLEAFLAAHDAGQGGMFERAGEIIDLFENVFFATVCCWNILMMGWRRMLPSLSQGIIRNGFGCLVCMVARPVVT
jgi:mannose-6-phosphate isomerase